MNILFFLTCSNWIWILGVRKYLIFASQWRISMGSCCFIIIRFTNWVFWFTIPDHNQSYTIVRISIPLAETTFEFGTKTYVFTKKSVAFCPVEKWSYYFSMTPTVKLLLWFIVCNVGVRIFVVFKNMLLFWWYRTFELLC